jgi:CotH kinase protein/Lamin Tail Domain/Secretion system C-terminal sorting domain
MESRKDIHSRQTHGNMKKVLFTAFILLSNHTVKAQDLILNELLVRNNLVYVDENQSSEPVIELFNRSTAVIQLNEYALSDKFLLSTKFMLPSQNLAPGQYVMVFLDDLNQLTPSIHSNFKLGTLDTLFLFRNGALQEQINPVAQALNVSFGRFPNGFGSFQYQNPSVGNSNQLGIANFPTAPNSTTIAGNTTIGTAITLSGTSNAHYTFTGVSPISTSPSYISPVPLPNPNLNTNKWSIIPTNPSTTFPIGEYTESRANDRGWVPPAGNQSKLSLFRACNFYANGIKSDEFVLPQFTQVPAYNLPILSITCDSLDLFSNQTGIYVFGNSAEANYLIDDKSMERLAHLHYFNADGSLNQKLKVGIRISGNGGRNSAQKSLRVRTNKKFESGDFILNGKALSKFSIRNSGHSMFCVGRDYLGHEISKTVDLEQANPNLVVVYINGEFWGLQDLREVVDQDVLGKDLKIKKSEIVILNNVFDVQDGTTSVPNDFRELVNWTDANPLVQNQNYQYIADKVDIDNFIDFYCTQIFLGNTDFPTTNIEFWRVENVYGTSKWRFKIKDLDGIFGGNCDTVIRTINTITYNLQTSNSSWIRAGKLFRNLLTNTDFKLKFSIRMADILNSNFKPQTILPTLLQYQQDINVTRTEHVNRWGYPSTSLTLAGRLVEIPSLSKWDEIYLGLDKFYRRRARSQRNHIIDYCIYTDSINVELNVNDMNKGVVQINSLLVDSFLTGANTIVYPWNGEYFQNVNNSLIAAARIGHKLQSWSDGLTAANRNLTALTDQVLTATFIPNPAFQSIIINEVSNNLSTDYPDKYVQYQDWIELYNPNPYPVYLEGLHLSNNPFLLNQFKIPPGKESVIPANGYSTYFASNAINRGPLHTNFIMNLQGTNLYLVDRDGTTIIANKQIPSMNLGESYGTYPNGSTNYQLYTNTSPNVSNALAGIINTELDNLDIFPNPTNSTITLSLKGDYQLFGMDGKVLLFVENTQVIDLSKLSTGLYYIQNIKTKASGKVLKN